MKVSIKDFLTFNLLKVDMEYVDYNWVDKQDEVIYKFKNFEITVIDNYEEKRRYTVIFDEDISTVGMTLNNLETDLLVFIETLREHKNHSKTIMAMKKFHKDYQFREVQNIIRQMKEETKWLTKLKATNYS